MSARADLFLTVLAPVIWGSSYIVGTEFLPGFPPMTLALLRVLPAGLFLLLSAQRLPEGIWSPRILVLGALNFMIFQSLLFVSAYRLPGDGGRGPLLVVSIAAALLKSGIRASSVWAALVGLAGVALLVLTPNATLDPVDVAAGLAGAASTGVGVVLTRKWRPPVPLFTFTACQLTAGGLLLLPPILIFEAPFPVPTGGNLLGLAWLGLAGAALSYALWFRGLARLDPAFVSSLGFLSPATAMSLGWLFLDQTLTLAQIGGVILILGGLWIGRCSAEVRRT